MRSKLYTIKLTGCTAPSGERYYVIDHHGHEYLIAVNDLVADRAQAVIQLRQQGLPIPGTGYVSQLFEEMAAIVDWPNREILSYPGWSGTIFARPNGDLFVPPAARGTATEPKVGYLQHPHRYSCTGSFKSAKRHVVGPLSGDDLATFMVALPFAPVVRSLVPRAMSPFTIQIVHDTKCSLLRRLCLSVTGSMIADGLAPDPIERIVTDPAKYIANSRDNLLVLGDIAAYLAGGSNKKRRENVRSLLFDHLLPSDGSELNTSGAPAPCCVVIEAEPIESLLELDSRAIDRLRQCVPTLRATHDTQDQGKAGRQWRTMHDRLSDNHGHHLARFQRRLVNYRADKGAQYIEPWLDKRVNAFRKAARRYQDDLEISQQLIDPFALVSVATDLAQKLKVLSRTEGPDAAQKACKRFIDNRPRPITAKRLLAEVAARGDVLAIEDAPKSMDVDQLREVPAFIASLGKTKRELWVPTHHKDHVFDWLIFKATPDFDQWYRGKGEKDRLGTKRVIGAWKDARVLRFKLP